MGKKYKFDNLGLDHYGYSPRFQKSDDVHPMSQLEGDEEPVKKEKGLKILNTNKLLTRLPVLLAHIKLKIFCINAIKSPQKFTRIQSSHQITGVYIHNNKLVVITEPKTIYFDLSEKADNRPKYEINYIIKHNELSAEHTIIKEIS